MSDIFDETEETLRTEQWIKIAKTAAPWVGGALGSALIVALAIWGWDSYQANASAKASEAFQAGMDASVAHDAATAKLKFEDTAKTGTPSYKAMALMELAALSVDEGKTDVAIKQLDDAAKASHDAMLSDLAAYKAALLVMEKAPFAEVQKRLMPLTEKDRPYAAVAKEALAMAKLQNGDVAGARTDLNVLAVGLDTPAGVKQRAEIYVQAIDSGAGPTAKAAVALPEAKMPAMPAGLPDGMQIQQ